MAGTIFTRRWRVGGVIKSFSSQNECEENVMGAKQMADQAVAGLATMRPQDYTPEQLRRLKINVAAIRASRCVREDDSRLRQ